MEFWKDMLMSNPTKVVTEQLVKIHQKNFNGLFEFLNDAVQKFPNRWLAEALADEFKRREDTAGALINALEVVRQALSEQSLLRIFVDRDLYRGR
jgi:hypothetical protein